MLWPRWVELTGLLSSPAIRPLLDSLTTSVTRLAAGSSAHTQPPVRPPQRVDRRLGEDRISELVAAYVAGSPSTRLTRQYGVGKGTVLRLLRERGVAIRRQGPGPLRHQRRG
jgi:hypothetical protein